MRQKRGAEDTLVTVVVISALVVLGLVFWAGGRRLYSRWQVGRGTGPGPAQTRPRVDDGVDRPPTMIPPLAMVGIAPSTSPPRNRPKTPAALPMPPITPDRE